jgi:hypothetical protein
MKSNLIWWGLGIALAAALMVLAANSEYRLGCRHADEIVAAGEELMALAEEGSEPIRIHDPLHDQRVPAGLRLLRPSSIQFSAGEAYIYTGGHAGKGFFIYKEPRDQPPVPSDCWQINPRLWWYEGA